MEHIELHLILRAQDVEDAWNLGLVSSLDEELFCEYCEEVVGEYRGLFYPYAIVLNENEEWVVCYECYWPVVNPKKPLA